MFQNMIGKRGLHNLNMLDLNDIGSLIEQNLKEIQKRVDTLSIEASHSEGFVVTPSATIVTPKATTKSEKKVHALDIMQRPPQWIIDMMNTQDHVGFGGNEMMLPLLGDKTQTVLWSNAFFPLGKVGLWISVFASIMLKLLYVIIL
ncbi:hypothetical protein REPUB_Repub11eG0180700 [Reevesia pubescens]